MRPGKAILLILFLWMVGCSAYKKDAISETTFTPTQTSTLVPLETPIPEQTKGSSPSTPSYTRVTPQYEILSPTAIRKGNIVIEVVSYTLSNSVLRFGIRFTGLDPARIPESSPEGTFSPISDVAFFVGEAPLEVEPMGGGGGGGPNEDGTVMINQDFSYRVLQAFPIGQPLHMTAVVRLHPLFEITEPIRFELEIVPQEGTQG